MDSLNFIQLLRVVMGGLLAKSLKKKFKITYFASRMNDNYI